MSQRAIEKLIDGMYIHVDTDQHVFCYAGITCAVAVHCSLGSAMPQYYAHVSTQTTETLQYVLQTCMISL